MPPSYALLLAYCVLVTLASLAGGWLPTRWRLGHTQMQVMMSFVGGLMLGVAILHLLPHAAADLPSLDSALGWMLIGLLAMFFVIRLFHVHQHAVADPSWGDGEQAAASGSDVASEHPHHNPCDHDHGDHTQATPGHPSHASPTPHAPFHTPHGKTANSWRFNWIGLAFGLALHSFFDGVALGAQLAADLHLREEAAFPGAGVFLVVLLHKPLDAMAITALMTSGGWSLRTMLAVNVGFAAICPLGALLFFWGAAGHSTVVGAALALAAGVFLCIALADILPEVSFHSHDQVKLSLALIVGVLLAIGIGFLEGAGHGHGHAHEAGHQHNHDHDH